VRSYVLRNYDTYKTLSFYAALVVELLNHYLPPLEHQQLRDKKSHRIWLHRTYKFWKCTYHFVSRQDISNLTASPFCMYKEAQVSVQQHIPRRLRHLHKLCRILDRFHLYQCKQPFLF